MFPYRKTPFTPLHQKLLGVPFSQWCGVEQPTYI